MTRPLLVRTETWQRLVVLYMLLRPGHGANALGLASFRAALEAVLGPTSHSLPGISDNQCFLS